MTDLHITTTSGTGAIIEHAVVEERAYMVRYSVKATQATTRFARSGMG
jgi:hypothetical protein